MRIVKCQVGILRRTKRFRIPNLDDETIKNKGVWKVRLPGSQSLFNVNAWLLQCRQVCWLFSIHRRATVTVLRIDQ